MVGPGPRGTSPFWSAEWLGSKVPPPGHVRAAGHAFRSRWEVLFRERKFRAKPGSSGWFRVRLSSCLVLTQSWHRHSILPPAPSSPVGSARGRILGAMAPRGRKRKAEASVVSTSEKQEKLENGKEQVEEAVVIEHW